MARPKTKKEESQKEWMDRKARDACGIKEDVEMNRGTHTWRREMQWLMYMCDVYDESESRSRARSVRAQEAIQEATCRKRKGECKK